MKNIIVFFLYIFSTIHVYAGNELEVVQRAANHIIDTHNHRLEIVTDGTCRIASYYQEWRYVNGVLALSMLDLYRITGNESYLTFVKDNYAFFFNKDNQTLMRKDYEQGIRNTGYYRFFRMGSLDDCGAMEATLVELNIISSHSEYTSYIKESLRLNEGWIEKEYASLVERAWNALASFYITVEGELKSVCMGTGISYDLPFYYDRSTPLNDAHGLGAVIQAGIEVHKLFSRK